MVLGRGERVLTVKLGVAPVPLGELVEMMPSELGMLMLEKFAIHGEPVSASGIKKGAEATLRAQLSRTPTDPGTSDPGFGHREFRKVLDRLIADGLGWLLSHELVGPAPASPSSMAMEWVVTSSGHTAIAAGSSAHVEVARSVPVGLHPRLQGVVRSNFEQGHYATAVFAALHQTTTGPDIITPDLDGTEHGRVIRLLTDTLTALGTPTPDHPVNHDDPLEAAALIHLADLLLRVTERAQAHHQ